MSLRTGEFRKRDLGRRDVRAIVRRSAEQGVLVLCRDGLVSVRDPIFCEWVEVDARLASQEVFMDYRDVFKTTTLLAEFPSSSLILGVTEIGQVFFFNADLPSSPVEVLQCKFDFSKAKSLHSIGERTFLACIPGTGLFRLEVDLIQKMLHFDLVYPEWSKTSLVSCPADPEAGGIFVATDGRIIHVSAIGVVTVVNEATWSRTRTIFCCDGFLFCVCANLWRIHQMK